ncbi:phospholipase [Pseudomonas anatoliensis]|uniref:phospholipase n=1 Tax=Pseudomonas anatoliensis TaxID=2710589 RepID=UPI001B338E0B|nr:phospholipase [Pseudomonas anatoliensis]MBP5954765.1 phospholipase [Pseudomonas anatoliensis]
MNNYTFKNLLPYQWMGSTPEIDNLSLFEMTLPGTHNAGCDWEASYAPFVANWVVCQDVSFYSQLNRGARALDLRLIYDSKSSGLAKFRFLHNSELSSRTLEDLVRDIKGFLERSYNEFIILDFHELKGGKEPFDYKYFSEMMIKHLGEYIIPSENIHLTLGQLKKVSRTQRLLVATPSHYDLDWKLFCGQVVHKWAGNSYVQETLHPTSSLFAYVIEVMKSPPSRDYLWSLSAAIWTLEGPQRILEVLDDWFDPERRNWVEHCNIISFDFIKNSKIVFFCQTANLGKAAKKSTTGAVT